MQPINNTHACAWKGLYRVGGVAALLAALAFRRNYDAEWTLFKGMGFFSGLPGSAPANMLDWFKLLQDTPLLGLTFLNIFDLVNYALVGLIFLALCVALWRVRQSLVAIAALSGFMGVAIAFATNQAFGMLALGSRYAAAQSAGEQAQLVAAGQALLAVHQNNTFAGQGLYPSYLLVSLGGLLLALVMLRCSTFGKTCAWMGILANVFGLSYYPVLAFIPALIFVPVSVSAVFLLIWYLLVARGLFR